MNEAPELQEALLDASASGVWSLPISSRSILKNLAFRDLDLMWFASSYGFIRRILMLICYVLTFVMGVGSRYSNKVVRVITVLRQLSTSRPHGRIGGHSGRQ